MDIQYFLLLLSFFTITFASKGFTARFRIQDWACLKNKGYDFTIIRAFQTIGLVDPAAIGNLERANLAKFKNIDIYINPSFTSRLKPEEQIEKIVNTLKNSTYRKMWINVQLNENWPQDKTKNCEFIKKMISKARNLHQDVGIGTNSRDWFKIMGPGCEITEQFTDLWLIFHDNKPHIRNFERFAQLKEPIIKEYASLKVVCDAEIVENVDLEEMQKDIPTKTDL